MRIVFAYNTFTHMAATAPAANRLFRQARRPFYRKGEPTVTNDSWFWVAMRGFGLFILLYLAVAFVVTIVSFFVYGGIVPIIISAGIAVLFVLFYMAIKRAGNTTDIH